MEKVLKKLSDYTAQVTPVERKITFECVGDIPDFELVRNTISDRLKAVFLVLCWIFGAIKVVDKVQWPVKENRQFIFECSKFVLVEIEV